MRRTSVILLALALLGCAKEPSPEQTASAIYHGGTIVTMDATTPTVSAFAVKDGRVFDIGTYEQMHDRHAGPLTLMIDLKDRALLPGYADVSEESQATAALAALMPDSAQTARIAKGEPADFVIFDHNPVGAVDTREIRVLETIRAGETVFLAGEKE
ncbi:MAG TPA: hypothetical protein VFX92_02335 [Candidatus Krumholzibacteria bacterium]|nr:hypothetical protein [Candidatus Krumholzibacteria bacterium]